MPVDAAVFEVLLSRAMPAYTRKDIFWKVSKAQGWAQIHVSRILDGAAMIWPQLEASEMGRWWKGFRSSIERNREARAAFDTPPSP